ncbi:UMP kinase [Candidatus Peregrinibacteria bacterium]|jgi:uridylate kinase|nr:UMP kinase [Candidatus Peregrinibacteria bacterium]MBT4632303.1 UMP kinase [Candidatus Peregrinibacteria bacterium]MBT5516887.1 UMP kinase [Candidatus Peregrinibacteria bacterium]MBT5824286.1 UMP kinase [Candidatus Peregrinibacteria bacterium]
MARVMIKLSGEVLGGENGFGADGTALLSLCDQIAKIVEKGVEVAIVVGGGNFWRFRDNKDLEIPRSASDTLGMMATIMNARLLAEALISRGVEASALAAHGNFYFVEPFTPSRGKFLLEKGKVVVCGGGTGNPYFTTDSAAALRALELECDVLLKGTKVDGVYDKDPIKHDDAEFFEDLTYDEVLKRELGVMDLTAITLCKENELPVRVFDVTETGNIVKAATGKTIGTLIHI